MQNPLIEAVEAKNLKAETTPFAIGDTVDVSVKIVEGEKERVQVFSGVVIMRKGSGINQMFTVRRIVNDEGVERIFPLHSPSIVGIKVRRHGENRRAKLYYLRDRVGKAVRLRERREAVVVPGEQSVPTKAAAAKE